VKKIIPYIKYFIKYNLLSRIPLSFLEALLNIVVVNVIFPKLKNVKKFDILYSKKYYPDKKIWKYEYEPNTQIWDYIIQTIGKNEIVNFIEFGVYEGRSIKYFSSKFINPKSTFIGFDSFEGLPDTSNHPIYYKGLFNVEGKIPTILDNRVSFIKGFFNENKKEIQSVLKKSNNLKLIHFDADIYSSTLFLLFQLSDYEDYYCIFDEFGSEECRALYSYLISNDSEVEFYATTFDYNFNFCPKTVFAKIKKR